MDFQPSGFLLFLYPVELGSDFDLRHSRALAHVENGLNTLGRIFGKQVAALFLRRSEIGIPVKLGSQSKIRADRNYSDTGLSDFLVKAPAVASKSGLKSAVCRAVGIDPR